MKKKLNFIFSIVRAQSPQKALTSSPESPLTTNFTPLRIRVQKREYDKKKPSFEFVEEDSQNWSKDAKCFVQIWEMDKWKSGNKKGVEHDKQANNTENELIVEIGGYIQRMGPGDFRFVSDGPVPISSNTDPNTRSIILIIDTLEGDQISSKKVTLPVPGEIESCLEIGIISEKTAGQKNYVNGFLPVHFILGHNDCICYLSDPSNPSSRCGIDRIHCYIGAWFGHSDLGENFYTFKYKNFGNSFTPLGSAESFEELLCKLGTELSQASNKDKKLGDLVILTHGITHTVNQAIETVKIGLPLFSIKSTRTLPGWNMPKEIDADEINELMKKGSQYYNYVDGKNNEKDGLISVITKSINEHIDDQTHIWLTGCNLGLNKGLMSALRSLFGGKAMVYSFTNRHLLYVQWDKNQQIISGTEKLKYGNGKEIQVWTSEGIQSIVHFP